jgi:hypothetical protein
VNYRNTEAVTKAAVNLTRMVERIRQAPRGAARRKCKRFQNVACAMARAYRVNGLRESDTGTKYADAYKAKMVGVMMRSLCKWG